MHVLTNTHIHNNNVSEDIHCPAVCNPSRALQKPSMEVLVTMATAEHRETTSLVHLSKVVVMQGEGDFTGTKSFRALTHCAQM